MVLWLTIAVLTAGVVAAVLRPLLAAGGTGPESADAGERGDVNVYRDQLREIEAEVDRGVMAPPEADAARIEIARRLLAAAGPEKGGAAAHRPGSPGRAGGHRRAVAVAAAVAVPVLTLLIYLPVGSPQLADRPLAARLSGPPDATDLAAMVHRVELRLAAHPDDGAGWDVLAPIYLRQQRFPEAARAYANALRLNGETIERLSGFAEATTMANEGEITPAARDAFARILAQDPGNVQARFWLATALEQEGDFRQAAEAFAALLAAAPAGAPWRGMVEARLAEVRARLDGRAQPAERGPSSADVAAAEKMSAEDRAQMIRQMVEGLAARLKVEGRDAAGWQRLVRAYVVLGERDKAIGALADARRALEGDAAALGALEATARGLGLGS